jgi:predicted RecA/RadA family phage recombinase
MGLASLVSEDCCVLRVAAVALASGAVIQDLDGKAGVVNQLNAVAAGDSYSLAKEGVFEMPKTASTVMLAGGRAYWDRANSKVTWNKATTGCFYIGRVYADAASTDTTVQVILNAQEWGGNRISWTNGIWATALVGSATATRDAVGSRVVNAIIATSEAEKSDALSVDAVAIADGPIFEARFTNVAIGSGAAVDVSLGLANGTHATDADAITEHVFFHWDGSDQKIYAQSKDGTTTVTATDTTVVSVDGTYQEFWIDGRDSTNVKLYINAVRVLSGSTFKLNAGTGPMKGLVHIEKTTGTTTGSTAVEFLNVRSTDLT